MKLDRVSRFRRISESQVAMEINIIIKFGRRRSFQTKCLDLVENPCPAQFVIGLKSGRSGCIHVSLENIRHFYGSANMCVGSHFNTKAFTTRGLLFHLGSRLGPTRMIACVVVQLLIAIRLEAGLKLSVEN